MTRKEPEYLQKRLSGQVDQQNDAMRNYYSMHAMIYDLTRWSFLFGRRELVKRLPFEKNDAPVILEVGCGTGYNLSLLQKKLPSAQLIGLDVSKDMLEQAQKRFKNKSRAPQLINKAYSRDDDAFKGKVDAILFSYSLTMINPQWNDLLHKALDDLKPGGIIGVVDFHNSPFQWFKTHMANNHVKMEGHLLPILESLFEPLHHRVGKGYFGIWQYLVFSGRKA